MPSLPLWNRLLILLVLLTTLSGCGGSDGPVVEFVLKPREGFSPDEKEVKTTTQSLRKRLQAAGLPIKGLSIEPTAEGLLRLQCPEPSADEIGPFLDSLAFTWGGLAIRSLHPDPDRVQALRPQESVPGFQKILGLQGERPFLIRPDSGLELTEAIRNIQLEQENEVTLVISLEEEAGMQLFEYTSRLLIQVRKPGEADAGDAKRVAIVAGSRVVGLAVITEPQAGSLEVRWMGTPEEGLWLLQALKEAPLPWLPEVSGRTTLGKTD